MHKNEVKKEYRHRFCEHSFSRVESSLSLSLLRKVTRRVIHFQYITLMDFHLSFRNRFSTSSSSAVNTIAGLVKRAGLSTFLKEEEEEREREICERYAGGRKAEGA